MAQNDILGDWAGRYATPATIPALQRSQYLADALRQIQSSGANLKSPLALGSTLLAQAITQWSKGRADKKLLERADQDQAAYLGGGINPAGWTPPVASAAPAAQSQDSGGLGGAIRSFLGGGKPESPRFPGAGGSSAPPATDPGLPQPSPSSGALSLPSLTPPPSQQQASVGHPAGAQATPPPQMPPATPPPQPMAGPMTQPQPAPPPTAPLAAIHADPQGFFSTVLGAPVTITSAYRSPAHNAQVPGASRTSEHMLQGDAGGAWDMKPPPGATNQQLIAALVQSGVPFDQIIDEGNHVHFGIGPKMRGDVLQGSNGQYRLVSAGASRGDAQSQVVPQQIAATQPMPQPQGDPAPYQIASNGQTPGPPMGQPQAVPMQPDSMAVQQPPQGQPQGQPTYHPEPTGQPATPAEIQQLNTLYDMARRNVPGAIEQFQSLRSTLVARERTPVKPPEGKFWNPQTGAYEYRPGAHDPKFNTATFNGVPVAYDEGDPTRTTAIPIPHQAMERQVGPGDLGVNAPSGTVFQVDPYNHATVLVQPQAGFQATNGAGHPYSQSAIPQGSADPTSAANRLTVLRDYRQEIKPVLDLATSLRRNVSAVRSGYAQHNGPGDIAMVNGLQKLIDEGVVREGDVNLQLQAQGISGGIAGAMAYLKSSGRFDDAIRAQMSRAAEGIYGSVNQTYRDRALGYKGIVERSFGAGSFNDVIPPETINALGWGERADSTVRQTPAPPANHGDPIQAARAAIAKGAPRSAVIKRLQDAGINPAGL